MKHYSLEFVGKSKKAGFKRPTFKKITIKLYYYSTKKFIKSFETSILNNKNDIVNIQELFIYNFGIRPKLVCNEKNSTTNYIIKL